jgi:hypothetical protein
MADDVVGSAVYLPRPLDDSFWFAFNSLSLDLDRYEGDLRQLPTEDLVALGEKASQVLLASLGSGSPDGWQCVNWRMMSWSHTFADAAQRLRLRTVIASSALFGRIVSVYRDLGAAEKDSIVDFCWNYGETDASRRVLLEAGLLQVRAFGSWGASIVVCVLCFSRLESNPWPSFGPRYVSWGSCHSLAQASSLVFCLFFF